MVTATYSAYCTTPLFPSWLASGTSVCIAFMGNGVPGPPLIMPGFVNAGPVPALSVCVAGCAGFFEELEMGRMSWKAAGVARKGESADVGFTASEVMISIDWTWSWDDVGERVNCGEGEEVYLVVRARWLCGV